ncbi:DNA polymerase III subunit gamma/tau [Ferrimonas gelatinilytica]|uniref:DNA-directed DNA polymerase n=1 Tax=Ferrimonas gelatinilytica TaxID=1255257 RepID=A0ABP9RYE9_9GAMM
MSYQVLARKWRPATFEQVVGQEHVLKALSHALQTERLHHAYLFTGTRGVGKTSIARLLAKGLNCETGITATPCGQCQNCREIAEGRFVDLLEIDAASRTKVDDTREILDNVQYQPVRGRFKVYLIDEVHMLSRHSFNALLKTLEEPPEHVKFLLATTDPQKLPVTVLSRCLQFNLKSVPPKRIAAHLARVLDAEGVPYDPPALDLLAQGADGSVRDGMSLTDQAIAHGAGALKLDQVQAMLGTLDSGYAVKLIQALGQADPAQLLAVLDEVEPFAPDHDDLLRQMSALLHQVALAQFDLLPQESGPGGAGPEQLRQWAAQWDREQIQLWYQILIQGRKDLAVAPDPRSGLEMTLLRAVAFAPAAPLPPVQARQPSAQHLAQTSADNTESPGVANASRPEPVSEHRPLAQPSSGPAEQAQEKPVSDGEPAEAPHQSGQPTDVDEAALSQEQSQILAQAEAMNQPPASGESHQSRPAAPQTLPPEAVMPDEVAMAAEQAMLIAEAQEMASVFNDERIEPSGPEAAVAPEPQGSAPAEQHTLSPEALATGDLINQVLADQSRLAERFASEEGAPEPDPKPKARAAKKSTAREAVSADSALQPPLRQDPAPAEATADEDRPPWRLDSEVHCDASPAPAPALERGVATSAESESRSELVPRPEPEPAPEPRLLQSEAPATAQPVARLPEPKKAMAPSVPGAESGSSERETDMQWYRAMSKLGVGARPRQLAVNSILSRDGDRVLLSLRPSQRHLNNDSVVAPLKGALEQLWQVEIQLEIEIADKPGRETPLEIRRRRHKEKQAAAREALLADPVSQWMQQELEAQLIEESVSYGPPADTAVSGVSTR